jgi:hypothetical protein
MPLTAQVNSSLKITHVSLSVVANSLLLSGLNLQNTLTLPAELSTLVGAFNEGGLLMESTWVDGPAVEFTSDC